MKSELFKRKLAKQLQARQAAQEFSGVILVRQGDETLIARAYGDAHRGWQIKNRLTTRFRIASVGKIFTAAAVMQLLDDGQLTLETRAWDVLDLAGTKIPETVTVRHLLTMTSGIADWIDENAEDFDALWAAFCREHPLYLFRQDADYLPVFAHLDPVNPVGEKHRYNGAGFMLLGMMIARLTGQSYFDAMRERIFQRAGMTQTDFLALDDVAADVAEGYVPLYDESDQITGWKKNIYAATAGPAADGGVTSTAEDMIRFSRALRAGRLCSMPRAKEMLSPQVLENDGNYAGYRWMYGYGCFVTLDQHGEVIRWGHTGEEDGVSCRLYYYPQQDVDVAILGNQSGCAGKIGWDIHRLVVPVEKGS